MAGFSFGTTPAPAPSTGFSFGTSTNTSTATASAPATSGFSFGGASNLGSPAPATTSSTGGFSFGSSLAAPNPAPTFGTNPVSAPAPSTGGFFGNASTTSTTASSIGAGFGNVQNAQQVQQQPAMVLSTSVYSTLPAQAQTMITQIHDMSWRQRRTLASVNKMAPRLLSTDLELVVGSEEEKKVDATTGSILTSSSSSSSSTGVDDNAYLPLQIEAILSNLHSLTITLERSMTIARGLQDKSRETASYGLTEVSWPIEALAARRGVQLTYLDSDGQPLSEKIKFERKMEAMLDKEAALVDRKEQIPSEFLWKLLKSFEERLHLTQREVDTLQQQLVMVVASNENNVRGYERQREHQVTRDDIASIYKIQNEALLRVAGEVATINDQVELLRSRWRRYAGSGITDPFRKADADDVLKRNENEARLRAVMLSSKPVQTSAPATVPTTGGLHGSAPAASASGGLFGSATTPAPATSGLFGSTPTSTSGGLFGSTNAPAPATGGLFGNTPAPAPVAGGLFGNTPAPAPVAAGGLFGGTSAPAPAVGGGLFGSAPAPTTGGLFGAPAPAAGGGLFGGTPAPTTGGGGLFGAPAPLGGLQRSSSSRSKNKGRSRR